MEAVEIVVRAGEPERISPIRRIGNDCDDRWMKNSSHPTNRHFLQRPDLELRTDCVTLAKLSTVRGIFAPPIVSNCDSADAAGPATPGAGGHGRAWVVFVAGNVVVSQPCLIILPAYNEELALPATIERLGGLPASYELVVVNDGSRDQTAAVARRLAAESPRPIHVLDLSQNLGIGGAVQTGYRFAEHAGRFTWVVQFDADGQHPAEAIVELVETCEREDWDLGVGSRFLKQTTEGDRSTFLRRMGIRFFAWLISLLTGARVTDPTSGFRCAGPRAWKSFARSYPDDYPEPESLFWCVRNGLTVGEIPVAMRQRTTGQSSIQSLRTAYYMIKVTLAILIDRVRRVEVHEP